MSLDTALQSPNILLEHDLFSHYSNPFAFPRLPNVYNDSNITSSGLSQKVVTQVGSNIFFPDLIIVWNKQRDDLAIMLKNLGYIEYINHFHCHTEPDEHDMTLYMQKDIFDYLEKFDI